MDNLNDIKAIWLSAKTDDLPKSDEMLRIVKKYRNNRVVKKLMIIFVALSVMVLMAFTLYILQPTMPSTWAGAILTIIACMVLVFTNTRSIRRFIELKDCNNKEFIEFLEQTRRNQAYYYKKTQVLGMALSTAGLYLYIYETVYRSTTELIITYIIITAWSLVLWLVVRPRSFKKQSIKLDTTIKKLENISKQID